MALLPIGEYRRVLFAALPLLLVCLTFSMLGTMQQNQMIDNKAGIECIDNIFYQGRRIQGGGQIRPRKFFPIPASISGGRQRGDRFSDDLILFNIQGGGYRIDGQHENDGYPSFSCNFRLQLQFTQSSSAQIQILDSNNCTRRS